MDFPLCSLCLHPNILSNCCQYGFNIAILILTTASTVQRSILFDLKDEIVPPTNETVTQVFARLSAYRDIMDGPQVSFTFAAFVAFVVFY